MAEHAILSASSAHRWLKCTPSALLEAKYPDTQSESAAEGTFAHAWAELQLKKALKQITALEYKRAEKQMMADQFYSQSLADYVDEYVSYVLECYMEAQETDPGAALLLEQHLDYSEWVPGGFGRGDAVIVADRNLHIIDLKYGKNVPVTAKDNPQLRLYALGAYHTLSVLYDTYHIKASIVQPRNGGISSEEMTLLDLVIWGQKIRGIAEIAIQGEGELVPGEHCRFCKAAPRCPKQAALFEEVQASVTNEPNELTDQELADILQRADAVISWLHKVQEYALTEARDNGRKWPGFKLVEGRSNRVYTDESQAAVRLTEAGYKTEDIYKPITLKGITDIQKLLGKKKFTELLDDLIAKPQGKPALVPEDDKRPEWNSAADDFEVID